MPQAHKVQHHCRSLVILQACRDACHTHMRIACVCRGHSFVNAICVSGAYDKSDLAPTPASAKLATFNKAPIVIHSDCAAIHHRAVDVLDSGLSILASEVAYKAEAAWCPPVCVQAHDESLDITSFGEQLQQTKDDSYLLHRNYDDCACQHCYCGWLPCLLRSIHRVSSSCVLHGRGQS